jgi:large subunit ribosomal protein L29
MKTEEIRNLPEDEIRISIDKASEKLFKMKFQARGTASDSPGAMRALKKDIARMLTILRERSLSK